MDTLTSAPLLTSKFKPSFSPQQKPCFPHRRQFENGKKNQSIVPVCFFCFSFSIFQQKSVLWILMLLCICWFCLEQVARLFGPAIFEASKLKVLFLGIDENKHPGNLPRTYTLTHSDVTSKLTLAISQTINNSQVFLLVFILIIIINLSS